MWCALLCIYSAVLHLCQYTVLSTPPQGFAVSSFNLLTPSTDLLISASCLKQLSNIRVMFLDYLYNMQCWGHLKTQYNVNTVEQSSQILSFTNRFH